MRLPEPVRRAAKLLASLELTIAALTALLVLVAACTLAQVRLGTFGAVQAYIRPFFVLWGPPGASWRVPIFPGGALLGVLLLANLVAAACDRLQASRRKLGIWLVHAGLVLLFAGEFVTGVYQVDARVGVEEGRTAAFSEEPRRSELVLIDETDPARDTVYAVPAELLSRGGAIDDERLPVGLSVVRYLPNARLIRGGRGDEATRGIGLSVGAEAAPPPAGDDEPAMPAAFVRASAGGEDLGTWLVASGLGMPQTFAHGGRSYRLAMRPVRRYFPFRLSLVKFSHDVYPGTDIPKNFSSLVRLSDPAAGPDREVLISMNNPLRYRGRTFYQSSFGKNDTLSIFQVVENPGWTLPYLSCALVALGLALHFLTRMRAAGEAA